MSSPIWLDKKAVEGRLTEFFGEHRQSITDFGRTVNQTFEAFVFAQVVKRYAAKGWKVTLVAPKGYPPRIVRLKFNTRGKPSGYTFARCERDGDVVQVRHGLRVATRHHEDDQSAPANVVLDVAVIRDIPLDAFNTDSFVPNDQLITFGEAKHMSAFAELVANFIGLVHEMKPEKLTPGSARGKNPRHPRPFLYVSGILYRTARGIRETIERRALAIEIHDHTSKGFLSPPVPTVPAPKRKKLVWKKSIPLKEDVAF